MYGCLSMLCVNHKDGALKPIFLGDDAIHINSHENEMDKVV